MKMEYSGIAALVIYLAAVSVLGGDPDKIKLVPARNLLIPFGRPITFKCFCDPSAVISSNVIFGWTVHFTNGASHYSHSRRKKLILLDMGIDIFDTNKTVSTLQFNGTDENVQSVECQFYDHDVGILHVSDVANITMFGPPVSPVLHNLTLDEELMTVNWNVPIIPGVILNFSLTLQISGEDIVVEVTDTQCYLFTLIKQKRCQSFKLGIAVSNLAGSNMAVFGGVLPGLAEMICYEVLQKDNGVFLAVAFNIFTCTLYEDVYYYLDIVNLENVNNTSSRNECADEHDLSGNRICLSMILPEKSNLSFTIMSSNSIGTVSMDPIMIRTGVIQEEMTAHKEKSNNCYISHPSPKKSSSTISLYLPNQQITASGLTVGITVGIITAVVLVLLIVTIVIFWLVYRFRMKSSSLEIGVASNIQYKDRNEVTTNSFYNTLFQNTSKTSIGNNYEEMPVQSDEVYSKITEESCPIYHVLERSTGDHYQDMPPATMHSEVQRSCMEELHQYQTLEQPSDPIYAELSIVTETII